MLPSFPQRIFLFFIYFIIITLSQACLKTTLWGTTEYRPFIRGSLAPSRRCWQQPLVTGDHIMPAQRQAPGGNLSPASSSAWAAPWPIEGLRCRWTCFLFSSTKQNRQLGHYRVIQAREAAKAHVFIWVTQIGWLPSLQLLGNCSIFHLAFAV